MQIGSFLKKKKKKTLQGQETKFNQLINAVYRTFNLIWEAVFRTSDRYILIHHDYITFKGTWAFFSSRLKMPECKLVTSHRFKADPHITLRRKKAFHYSCTVAAADVLHISAVMSRFGEWLGRTGRFGSGGSWQGAQLDSCWGEPRVPWVLFK